MHGADFDLDCGGNGQKLCPGFGFFAVIRSRVGHAGSKSIALNPKGLGRFGKQLIYQLPPDYRARVRRYSGAATAAFLQQVMTACGFEPCQFWNE